MVAWGQELARLVLGQGLLADCAAVIYSDYGKGALSRLPEPLWPRNLRVPVLVDPKGFQRESDFAGAFLLKVNALDTGLHPPLTPRSVLAYVESCCLSLDVRHMVVTDGPRGLWGYTRGDPLPFHVPGHDVPIADVTGAGDTTMAALTAALTAGEPLDQASRVANLAASLAVSQYGTTVVGWFEINQAAARSDPAYKRVRGADEARLWAEAARAGQNRTVVLTNGCFDVLHPGHVDLLTRAKAMGSLLFVAINSDAGVHALKGAGRPVLPEESRLDMLASFVQVDAVALFQDEAELHALVLALKPNFLVKGTEWVGQRVTGADYVAKNGGQVVFLKHQHQISTTALLQGASVAATS